MESYDYLVIILSVMLAFFLTLGIIIFIYVLKYIKQIGRITEKAEQAAENIASASNTFKVAFSLSNILNFFRRGRGNESDEDQA